MLLDGAIDGETNCAAELRGLSADARNLVRRGHDLFSHRPSHLRGPQTFLVPAHLSEIKSRLLAADKLDFGQGWEAEMGAFIFTCPSTGLHVQHWLDDIEDVSDDEFEGVICKACAKLHFINRKTGELLVEKKY